MATTFSTAQAVISAGDDLSSTVDCGGALVGLIFPSAWNSSAGVSFQISADNIDYYNLHKVDGKEFMMAVKPGGAASIAADVARGIRFLKIRSGPVEKTVAQNADRT